MSISDENNHHATSQTARLPEHGSRQSQLGVALIIHTVNFVCDGSVLPSQGLCTAFTVSPSSPRLFFIYHTMIRVKRGNLAHWGNSGQRVKSSLNHKVHTLFLAIVVSMNW